MIGVDMGVKRLFTLSNGDFEEPIDVKIWQKKNQTPDQKSKVFQSLAQTKREN